MSSDPRQTAARVLPLIVIVSLCFIVLQFTNSQTRPRIQNNQQKATMNLLDDLMALDYDNKLLQDMKPVEALNSSVFRARKGGKNIGLVIMPLDVQGYSGNIRLALGITYDGDISGVRIISHRETAGLGDAIHQDVSPWVFNFNGRSLANTAAQNWAVKTEGGDFDAISGATITPRIVINKVRDTLAYYQLHREELYR